MANDIASPFPDLDWRDQSVIAVDTGNTSAKITAFTIHLRQDTPDDVVNSPEVFPLFSYAS